MPKGFLLIITIIILSNSNIFSACLESSKEDYCAKESKQTMRPSSIWRDIIKNKFKPLNPQTMKAINFIKDCSDNIQENQNILDHEFNNTTLRIATYNVHMWRNAEKNEYAFQEIIDVISKINADIIILQEAGGFAKHESPTWKEIQRKFEELGYVYNHEELYLQCFSCTGGDYGNMLLIKKHLKYKIIPKKIFDIDRDQDDTRGFVAIQVNIAPEKSFNIYGTHLDIWDESGKRRTQEIKELINIINKNNQPCIIAADCNAVRKSDYQYNVDEYTVWDLLNDSTKCRLQIDAPTKALDILEKNGFADCFTKNEQPPPKFTSWAGTAIDFLWLNKQWNLPIDGAYVYYSSASDHLPIIMDIKI